MFLCLQLSFWNSQPLYCQLHGSSVGSKKKWQTRYVLIRVIRICNSSQDDAEPATNSEYFNVAQNANIPEMQLCN